MTINKQQHDKDPSFDCTDTEVIMPGQFATVLGILGLNQLDATSPAHLEREDWLRLAGNRAYSLFLKLHGLNDPRNEIQVVEKVKSSKFTCRPLGSESIVVYVVCDCQAVFQSGAPYFEYCFV